MSPKVAGHGRFVKLSERAQMAGDVFASIANTTTEGQNLVSLGNMFPVDMAGRALRPIWSKWQFFEERCAQRSLHHWLNYLKESEDAIQLRKRRRISRKMSF